MSKKPWDPPWRPVLTKSVPKSNCSYIYIYIYMYMCMYMCMYTFNGGAYLSFPLLASASSSFRISVSTAQTATELPASQAKIYTTTGNNPIAINMLASDNNSNRIYIYPYIYIYIYIYVYIHPQHRHIMIEF